MTTLRTSLRTWLRIVGGFYLLQFAMMVLVRAPIRTQGPAGALAQAALGDPLARFLVDTWVTFGLEVGAIGIGLLLASRAHGRAHSLVVTIIAIEFGRGIVADLYLLARGNRPTVPLVWMGIHALIIVSGLHALRGARPRSATEGAVVPSLGNS